MKFLLVPVVMGVWGSRVYSFIVGRVYGVLGILYCIGHIVFVCYCLGVL
jgi:hypothetical protein